jgi:diguanylate cyclase (GGDEF)-like protein
VRAMIRPFSLRREPAEPAELVPVSTAIPAITGTTIDVVSDLLRDDLTQLGSLLALRQQLQLTIGMFQPFGVRPALCLIDIDGFARINAVYGAEIGDYVLAFTAARLRHLVPGDNATYRTGGDEFAAVLDPTPMIDAVAWAEGIQSALSQPVEFEGLDVAVSVSVAVVMLGQRHRVDGLLRDADVTMYRAKAEGGNRVDIYNWEIDSWATARKRGAAKLEQLEDELEELRLQNRLLTEALTLDLDSAMPNALAFEADHQQLDAWRKRSGEPYCILRARVDGIDEARRAFRSPDGAKVLISVAHAIRDTVRLSDRAFVIAEGEFAVLLRGSVTKQAITAGVRIRTKLDTLALEHPSDPTRRVTLTIAAIEAGFRHSQMDDVLREANDLLEKAVEAGGDRLVWPH